MRHKVLYIIAGLILIATVFTGCWDKTELEDEGYVSAIGIDKGSGRNLRITFQVTNPKVVGAGRSSPSSGEKKSEIISIDAPSILTARDLLTVTSTRKITLSHAKVVIVGEDFARDENFFRYLEGSLRDKEMRRIMTLMVSREDAEDFIKNNNPLLEDRMQKFYEFMSRRWKETGYVPPFSNLNRFMQRTESGEGLFLATYASTKERTTKKGADEGAYFPGQIEKEGGNPAEMIGSAVFKHGRMIGALDGNETRLVSMMRQEPETKTMLVTFTDPKDNRFRLDARILRSKRTKVELNIVEDRTEVDVTIPLNIDILSIPSFIDYVENKDNQKMLKEYLEEYMSKISVKLVEKTQSEFQADPFQWELAARKKFLTQKKYKEYGWMKHYAEAKVNIHYDITLRNFGKQLAPPKDPMQRINDEEKGL